MTIRTLKFSKRQIFEIRIRHYFVVILYALDIRKLPVVDD